VNAKISGLFSRLVIYSGIFGFGYFCFFVKGWGLGFIYSRLVDNNDKLEFEDVPLANTHSGSINYKARIFFKPIIIF